jgi:NAD(P)-dependent dehydrogenase (short-subunit alcohol dehydrogenase family)
MGIIGCCCKFSAVLVALFAILIGTLISGHLKKTGIFQYHDRYETSRGTFFKGMMPVHHEGTPWGFTEAEIPDLTGETILVTGGNVGLGYWTAYHMAAKSANVIIGCRSQAKCDAAAHKIKEATGKIVETALLDLSSFASIRACAKEIAAKHSKLDSLNLNAGVMVPPFGLTKDGLEMQIGTNHFGHFLLTDLLLPQLKAAAKSRGVATVVSVSSAAHFDSYPEGILPSIARMNNETTYQRDKAYGQSKLANVLFAQELAERLKSNNILVNSVHPGGVDTDLPRHAHDLVASVSPTAADIMSSMVSSVMWHPRDAALTQIYCSVGPSLRHKKITSKYFHPIARETKPDPHAADLNLQKHLWSLTEEFIKAHP